MNGKYQFEKTGIKTRLSETSALFIFILIALIISLLVMNLLIFPIALFSVNNKETFTFIFNHLLRITIIGFLLYLLIKQIIFLKNEGFTGLQITKSVIKKPLSLLMTFLIVFVTCLILIVIIYIILKYNYYLLYKLINI